MNTSTSIVNLAKALFKFQCSITNIGKDATNSFLKNKYATLTNILDNINEPLNSSGLVIMQNPGADGDMITLSTVVIHAESGEFIESTFAMPPVKRDPQAVGSCISYMRRYALTSILKLNVDDDDGNEASNVREQARKVKLSGNAQDIKNRMELAETMEELKLLGQRVSEEISSDDEKKVFSWCYREATKRIRETT